MLKYCFKANHHGYYPLWNYNSGHWSDSGFKLHNTNMPGLDFVTALFSRQNIEMTWYMWLCNATIPLKLTWNCNIAQNPKQYNEVFGMFKI